MKYYEIHDFKVSNNNNSIFMSNFLFLSFLVLININNNLFYINILYKYKYDIFTYLKIILKNCTNK